MERTYWTQAIPSLAAALVLAACTGSSAPESTGGGTGPGTTAPPHVLAMEDTAFYLVNAERTTASLGTLYHDALLRDVARAHSLDMLARGFFAHTNPGGEDPFDRMRAAGVTFSRAAENIAWNQGFSDPAQTAVTGWMNSPGHRANILDGGFTHSGLGIADDGNGRYYFTQVFTTPTSTLVARSWVVETGDPTTDGWFAAPR